MTDVLVTVPPVVSVINTYSGPPGLRGEPGITGPAGEGLQLQGWVAAVEDLPSNAAIGDVYMVEADGLGYVMGSIGWSDGVSLQGPQGVQGEIGPQGPQGLPGADGADGSDGAPGEPGTDGREIELHKGTTYVQWRYAGDSSWTNLVALADLTGPQGLQGTAGSDGAAGTDGTDGADGADGREVELQVTASYIQWRYVGGTWANLIALSALTGPQGAKGDTGERGPTGLTGPAGPSTPSADMGNLLVAGTDGLLKTTATQITPSAIGAAAASHAHGDISSILVMPVASIPEAGSQVAGVLYIGY